MLKVTCAIIISQNKILVTQCNSNSDHPFKWEFPGGKLNSDETVEECIIREISEELDIEIEILESIIPVIYDYGFKQIELIPFVCKIKSGKIKLFEHHDFMWIALSDLEKTDFNDADKELIQVTENELILKKYLWKDMNDTR